jgi:hypothetical protein
MNNYLRLFEKAIAVEIKKGNFGKNELVSARGSKLAKTGYGRSLGNAIDSKEEFAIDYYGYIKKSRGLLDRIREERKILKASQLKSIQTKVVHFPSIKIDQIADFGAFFISGFPGFKKHILKLRGFQKEKSNAPS